MEFVSQRGDCDCAIAAMAMVTGLPYETVLAATPKSWVEHKGVLSCQVEQILGELGFATRQVFIHDEYEWFKQLRGVRLAIIQNHYIVIDGDNRVLDPARGPNCIIEDYSHWRVYHMWEVHDVRRFG